MNYDSFDSSGTDDDLPPSHQNRVMRGSRVNANGRPSIVGTQPYPRVHNDMETQIHGLEQDAYSSVLRAFKAQSDAITWEKESLITELRKELRVSDEEHRELLGKVNVDDIIRRIREWRQAGGSKTGFLGNSQPVKDAIPSPTVSASRKKQKMLHAVPSLSAGASSPALQQQLAVAPPMQISSSVVKRGAPVVEKAKNPKSGQTLPGASSMKSLPYPSTGPTGRAQVANRGSSGVLMANEPAETGTFDRYIGKKVLTRWPDDNNFYEAVITDYNPADGRHALVYDMSTANETWEWVNLNEISREDIRWVDMDPGFSHRTGHGGMGRGVKKSIDHGGATQCASRGRGGPKSQTKKDFPPSQNGTGKKIADDIEILHTDTLIKEVERVFGVSHPDPLEIEKAKEMLKEHEHALIDAIATLAEASDGESEGEQPFSHDQSIDCKRGQNGGNKQHAAQYEDEGDQTARGGRAASDNQQDGDDI